MTGPTGGFQTKKKKRRATKNDEEIKSALKLIRDVNISQEAFNLPKLESSSALLKKNHHPSDILNRTAMRDSMSIDQNNMRSTLPLVDMVSEIRANAANVDYLYYSDHEDDYSALVDGEGGQSSKGLHNRSQSMNNLLFTAADKKAINSYLRWNDTNTQAK